MSWEALEPFVCPAGAGEAARTPERAVEGPQTQVGAPAANDTAKAGSAATAPPRKAGGAFGKLYDLMDANGVKEDDVMAAVVSKGYFPRGTALTALPENFVEGVLVGAWPQVFEVIKNLNQKSI